MVFVFKPICQLGVVDFFQIAINAVNEHKSVNQGIYGLCGTNILEEKITAPGMAAECDFRPVIFIQSRDVAYNGFQRLRKNVGVAVTPGCPGTLQILQVNCDVIFSGVFGPHESGLSRNMLDVVMPIVTFLQQFPRSPVYVVSIWKREENEFGRLFGVKGFRSLDSDADFGINVIQVECSEYAGDSNSDNG